MADVRDLTAELGRLQRNRARIAEALQATEDEIEEIDGTLTEVDCTIKRLVCDDPLLDPVAELADLARLRAMRRWVNRALDGDPEAAALLLGLLGAARTADQLATETSQPPNRLALQTSDGLEIVVARRSGDPIILPAGGR